MNKIKLQTFIYSFVHSRIIILLLLLLPRSTHSNLFSILNNSIHILKTNILHHTLLKRVKKEKVVKDCVKVVLQCRETIVGEG